MFGCRLDSFARAGFEGKPLPDTDDDIEMRAYLIGRGKAGLPRLKVVTATKIEQRARDAWKTLQVVGA